MTVEFVLGVVLPITLIVLMMTLGVGLRPADVAGVLWRPRVWAGLAVAQVLLLPLLAVTLVTLLRPDPILALCLIAVAAAPGGTFANIFTFIAGGNLALSVVLTAVTTLGAAFVSPAVLAFTARLLDMEASVGALDPLRITRDLTVLVLMPLTVGVLIARFLPATAERVRRVAEPVSAAAILSLILMCIIVSAPALPETMPPMLVAGGLFTAGALALGYFVSCLLPAEDRSAVSFGFGVRNTAIALFLASGAAPDVRSVACFISYFIVAASALLCVSLILRQFGRRVHI